VVSVPSMAWRDLRKAKEAVDMESGSTGCPKRSESTQTWALVSYSKLFSAICGSAPDSFAVFSSFASLSFTSARLLPRAALSI